MPPSRVSRLEADGPDDIAAELHSSGKVWEGRAMAIHGAAVDVDERIVGCAEFVEQHAGSDAAVADALAAHMKESGIEEPASLGVTDVYRALVQRFRGRRLVDDFGEHEFSLDWLGFHVPQGAKGQLKLSSSEMLGYGLKLEIVGFGGGSGRRRTCTVQQDFRERTKCLALGQRVRAHLRTFADRGAATATHVQVDVIEVLAEERRVDDPCPICFAAEVPLDLVPSEPVLDFRGDPLGQRYTRNVKLESDASADIGIPLSIPGLKLAPAVSMKRTLQLECEITYDLPGGFRYTPYERADGWSDLPSWRRT